MNTQKVNKLLNAIKDTDHWDMLGELHLKLDASASNIEAIHSSFDKISENRKELAHNVADIHVILEMVKLKLSIMPQEFKAEVDRSLDQALAKYASEEEAENFDEMEF